MTAVLWAAGAFLAWAALALGIAVVVGRAIHTADQRCGPCDVDAYEPERLPTGGIYL